MLHVINKVRKHIAMICLVQVKQEWRKGGRVPAKFRGASYQVNDWRSRDLPAPPRGHRWVRVNGDYVLVAVAVATGVIAQILLGGH